MARFQPTRRDLLKSGAALTASVTIGFPGRAVASAPEAPLPLVVDSSVNVEKAAPALAARGAKVVMRYYARDPAQEGYESKRLTQREAKAIHASEMAIGLTYQRNNGSIRSFSREEALAAAAYCMSRDAGLNPGKPEVIHHPPGTAVYFGVDTNAFTEEQMKIVVAYFDVIGEQFAKGKAPFKVGVYGSGASCDRVRASTAGVDHFWLAGVASGWAGTREFYNRRDADWNLFQNALEVSVDTNLVNPRRADKTGAFASTELLGALDDTRVRSALRFIKQPEEAATFHRTPNGERIVHFSEFRPFRRDYIEASRMVSVLEPGPEWTKVEVTFAYKGVGTINQGYVRTERLAPISQMP